MMIGEYSVTHRTPVYCNVVKGTIPSVKLDWIWSVAESAIGATLSNRHVAETESFLSIPGVITTDMYVDCTIISLEDPEGSVTVKRDILTGFMGQDDPEIAKLLKEECMGVVYKRTKLLKQKPDNTDNTEECKVPVLWLNKDTMEVEIIDLPFQRVELYVV